VDIVSEQEPKKPGKGKGLEVTGRDAAAAREEARFELATLR
jgi:hypothetical protein